MVGGRLAWSDAGLVILVQWVVVVVVVVGWWWYEDDEGGDDDLTHTQQQPQQHDDCRMHELSAGPSIKILEWLLKRGRHNSSQNRRKKREKKKKKRKSKNDPKHSTPVPMSTLGYLDHLRRR